MRERGKSVCVRVVCVCVCVGVYVRVKEREREREREREKTITYITLRLYNTQRGYMYTHDLHAQQIFLTCFALCKRLTDTLTGY
jgi:hypothetical protein